MLAMAQLGVYEEHPVVVRTAGCNESIGGAEPPTPSAARLCRKFVEGFVRPLQGRSSLATDASRHAAPLPPMTTLGSLRRVHRDMGRSHVCFRRLLAGGYHEMFNTPSHAGKEPWLALYRHRVLAYHGIVPAHAAPPPLTSHKLLLIRKQGRRGIHNFEQVRLRADCGLIASDEH